RARGRASRTPCSPRTEAPRARRRARAAPRHRRPSQPRSRAATSRPARATPRRDGRGRSRREHTFAVAATDRRETESGIEVKPVYAGDDAKTEREAPGEYPYTRGPYPDMYRGRPWTIRQYAGFGSAEETNKRFRYLLERGQAGLSVAFDLPTQPGYDSDDPRAAREVRQTGVAADVDR